MRFTFDYTQLCVQGTAKVKTGSQGEEKEGGARLERGQPCPHEREREKG